MVGPRPAGAPGTSDDDRKLATMIAAGDDKTIMARKLKQAGYGDQGAPG
jgi:hypothetical protein